MMSDNNDSGGTERQPWKRFPEMVTLKFLAVTSSIFIIMLSQMGFGNAVQEVNFGLVQLVSITLTVYSIRRGGKFLLGPSSVPFTFGFCYGVISFVAVKFIEITLKTVANSHYLFKLYRKLLGFLGGFNVALILIHAMCFFYDFRKSGDFGPLVELL